VYTKPNEFGYYLQRLDFSSASTPASGVTQRFKDNPGEYFRIYQTSGGNFPHRPIYGASVLEKSIVYRITSTPAVFM
jgi:hypothetical protein